MNYPKFLRVLRKKYRALFGSARLFELVETRAERLREKNRALLTEVQTLRRHVQYDALTDIRNRVGFAHEWDRFVSEIVRRHWWSGSLLYIDLNGFKPVNDLVGHAAGDKVLREVAKVLEREVRPGDTAARIGGDEFVVLLPGASLMGTFIVIERLRKAVRVIGMDDPDFACLVQSSNRSYVLDFSAGMFFLEFGLHPPSLNEALANAEANMPKMIERRDFFRRTLDRDSP